MNLLERIRAQASVSSNPGGRQGVPIGDGKTGDSAQSPVPLVQVRDDLAAGEHGNPPTSSARSIPEWRRLQLADYARRGLVAAKALE